ncbi:GON-4-like protein isoform X2 [Leptopilina heterotoma]|uniref:GON-4-like protein isoform X2 n=1 Tax=Leptopilina heterotoma TaxID=63436 RepID=UPI001CA85EBC|nr:GON-4-like protein isoform X2 [Leptopilina heterotoma]
MEGSDEQKTLKDYEFSFEIDIDEMKCDKSSDSDTNDLEIDVSEVDDNYDSNNIRSKRVTCIADAFDGLDKMEEEIERQLDAKAAKINLTATNVKNILRHVITNEQVRAMVRRRLNKSTDDDGMVFEPKLTRSKAKELGALGQPNIPWPSTPVKTASAEVQVLIEEELPEDSSDEEYDPDKDLQSDDDDKEADNSIGSDVDSQPSTPATPLNDSLSQEAKIDTQYDSEGVFKIPEIPHVPTEEESIGQRTRSKLCLSETPLEYIEQAFIPPDITTDMYDHDCDLDEDYRNFLKDFTQPLPQEVNVEDDPEADPEYDFFGDETELLDKEEFRMDRAVNISRKEVNNLMDELLEYANEYAHTHSTEKEIGSQETPKKKKSTDYVNPPIETNHLNSPIELISVLSNADLPKIVSIEQRQLLNIQLRQHIQLMSQQFLMCYKHPEYHKFAKGCKSNIESLRFLSSGPQSAFNVDNLPHALQLITDCEDFFKDEKFSDEYVHFLAEDMKKGAMKSRKVHTHKFHPSLENLIMESKALTYPNLLPHMYTRSDVNNRRCRSFFKSEENLVALGLEQFKPFVLDKGNMKHKYKTYLLHDVIRLTRIYLLPARDSNAIYGLIKKYENPHTEGPVRYYLSNGKAPSTIHVISLDPVLRAPKEQPVELLPEIWRKFTKHVNNEPSEIEGLINGELAEFLEINPGKHVRNPIVNMMPSVDLSSGRNARKKGTVKNTIVHIPSNFSEEMILPDIMDVDTHIVMEMDVSDNQQQPTTSTSKKLSPRSSKIRNIQTVEPTIQVFATESGEMIVPEIMDVHTNVEMEIPDNDNQKRLPQLRQTTTRLAKMRSAQNIKSMTQVITGKEISPSSMKAKGGKAHDSSKSSDFSSTSSLKGDNEDEIAELMRASTTIKKNAVVNRKKAKQARELENIKRMIESENELNTEERATKFAESYLQKLHSTLESSDPETFKAIIKLFLEYSEKLDNILQTENENEMKSDEGKNVSTSGEKKSKMNDLPGIKDMVAINFYREVCEKLENYPDMSSDFLLFLNSYQAGMVNKSLEWMMLQRMQEFVQVAQVYFAKQPSRLTKVMQSISQLASAPYTPLKSVYEAISPILKGSPIVMDLFLQVFPQGKPPESLFAPQFFENITCPVGPHDKSKISTLDLPDLYENIELPVSTTQEDPYGGENCKCNCHDVADSKLKSGNEHCASCGTRFLNGRIYLQTSEGLRPAKITFPGENDEKLENIARVSLKTAEKFVYAPPQQKRRRKSSKNDSTGDETNAKQAAPFKVSPIKEASTLDENLEKLVTTKSKRGPRSPPKTAQSSSSGINSKRTILICKGKRFLKAGKRDTKQEKNFQNSSSESLSNKTQSEESSEHSNIKMDSFMDDDERNALKLMKSSESSDSEGSVCDLIEERLETRPWSRQEDAILLQSIKKDYSEKSFISISQALENRSVQQVKDRCQMLLKLLEKIS